MGGLDPGELSEARADLEETLADEAIIERPTSQSDGAGGRTTNWSVFATVPCAIAPIGGGEPVSFAQKGSTGTAGDRIDDRTTHILTIPAETEIEETDRVVVSESTYEVSLVRKRGSQELVRRVQVKETFE